MTDWLEQAEAMRGKAITPERSNTYDSNIKELKKQMSEFLSEEEKEKEHKDAWPNEKSTEAPGGEQGKPPSREGFDEVKKCSTCGYNYSGSKCDNPGCEASGNVTEEVKARRKKEAEEEAEREKIRSIRERMARR